MASSQQGCLSLAQALACGLSREAVKRRLATARWIRVLPRVYVVAGASGCWEQRLFAAVLWVGGDAAVAGVSAAALWELPGFRPGPVEVAHTGAKQSRAGIVVRRVRLGPDETTRLRRLPVTTPERTLVDVAGRSSNDTFDAALHDCLHRRLTTLAEIQTVANRLPERGHPGSGRVRRALAAYSGTRPAGSPLEARVARRLRASRLPPPARQHEVRVAGRLRYLDFAWPERRVALEVDGYRWHSSRSAWESDRRRLADLRRAGWTVVNVTYDDVVRRWVTLERELAQLLA